MTTINTNNTRVLPFLKWAGGKRWLAKGDFQIIPPKYNRYIEPFIGSAAVFFSTDESPFILADSNQELINCYSAIKSNYIDVEKLLRSHHNNHSYDYYYKMREYKPRTPHTRAARFIYLNRTCWNGLYRVNLNGEFNVPKGTKKNVVLETDNFELISNLLQCGEIYCQDFEKTLQMAKKGDFVFVDPPYTVKHNYNGFLKYNERIFSWDDQVRLKECIVESANRGVMVTMTNADHKSIRQLYSGICRIDSVNRNSVIAGTSVHRGLTSEVIMRIGWD